jgi:hypothetical protein
VLWLNARVVPSAAMLERLCHLLTSGKSGIVESGAMVVAAVVPAGKPFDGEGQSVPLLDEQPSRAPPRP